MSELLIGFMLALVIGEFWRNRQQAELANQLVKQYCARQEWQLVSVARHSGELMPLLLREFLRKPSCFVFEFSTDGVAQGTGELILTGLTQPLFRVEQPEGMSDEESAPRLAHPERGENVIPFPTPRH